MWAGDTSGQCAAFSTAIKPFWITPSFVRLMVSRRADVQMKTETLGMFLINSKQNFAI